MTTQFTRLAAGFCVATALGMAGCAKDETKVVATPSGQPTLTTTGASNQVLLQNNASNNAVTFTWTPVTFGFQSTTPTYSLQFDKKGNNFANAQTVNAGTSLSKTLTVNDLNTIYQSLKLVNTTSGAQQAASTLDVRVIASIGTPAGANSASTASNLTATPYNYCAQPATANAWTIIGPAGAGWSTDVAMVYNCSSNTFTYTGPLNADDFKFRYGNDWKANYGGSSSTGGALTQDGPNLHISTAKNYTVVLTPGTIDPATGKANPGTFTIQ